MSKQMCDRCRKEESIPTHQFVKFDNEVRYLCSDCWQHFREWYYRKSGTASRLPPTIA